MIAAGLYSIVRFRPFVETGEFANVGVVAVDTATGDMAHKLSPRRVRRISVFFQDMDPRLLASAISFLDDEIRRVAVLASKHGAGEARRLFDHLTKGRESTLVFSEPRAIRLENGVAEAVDKLFAKYVKRAFASAEYRETVPTREIKNHLRRQHIAGYGKCGSTTRLSRSLLTWQVSRINSGH